MNHSERQKVMFRFIVLECFAEMEKKNPDYAVGEEEANANFRRSSEMSKPGMDEFDSWWILFLKHHFALESWMKFRKLRSETLKGRIMDLINYLLIFFSMGISKKLFNPNQYDAEKVAEVDRWYNMMIAPIKPAEKTIDGTATTGSPSGDFKVE